MLLLLLMTRICHLFKCKELLQLQHRSVMNLIFIIFSVVLFGTTMADEKTYSRCDGKVFVNSTYFISVNHIELTSKFFSQIPSTFFKNNDELFVVSRGEKSRVENYFDDSELSLLKNNLELINTLDINLPVYRAGREQVILKNNTTDSIYTFETRQYMKKATPLDKHILFGSIKRNQRLSLIDMLNVVTGSVENFDVNLQIQHKEVVQLYRHFGIEYGAITLDRFQISNFGIPNTFTLLKFEIFFDLINDLEVNERKYLVKSFCQTTTEFGNTFPEIPVSHQYGYQNYYQLATKLLPNRSLLKKYPILYQIGQIFVLTIIGFLFIYLLVGRYKKNNSYRKINTGRYDRKDDYK